MDDRWGRLTARAGELAGQLAQVQADLVAFTAELIESGDWAGDGVRSPAHWLQVYTGLSPAHAQDLVQVAQRGEELATTTVMMAEGRLTLDQAAVIAKHVPDWAVGQVERLAELTTVTQLRRAVVQYPFEEPGEQQSAPAQEPASLSMSTFNGRFHLRFETNASDGALVQQALQEAKDALFTAGNEKATLADALVEMANRSLAAVTSVSRRDNYRVMLHLSTDGTGWLERRGALPSELRRNLTCDGTVRPVWETEGQPVSVGRSQRIVPHRTRRLVEDRDKGCRYPGCPATGFLENHHIVHWEDGGPTDYDNLVSLCPGHHADQHKGHFEIVGDPSSPGGLEFRARAGWTLGRSSPPGPVPLPDRPPPIREGIRGERLGLRWVHFVEPAPV